MIVTNTYIIGFLKTIVSTDYFYSKTSKMHQCIKSIFFGMTLYMFRMVFSSIIRISRLYIQQQAFVKETLLSA